MTTVAQHLCTVQGDPWCDLCNQEADVYVVQTPAGFTEAFDLRTIETLERLGLIRHVRDGHVLEDGRGRGVGPLHRFYGPA